MTLPTCQTELRHLDLKARRNIETLLNDSNSWSDLIKIIPKRLDPLSDGLDENESGGDALNSAPGRLEPLIDHPKSQLLENQLQLNNGSPAKALLDYWSTYGVRRPTVEHLLYYAARSKLNRLVNYLLFDLVEVHLRSAAELGAKTRAFLVNNFFFDNDQDNRLRQFIDKLSRESDFGLQKDSNNSETDLFSARKERRPHADLGIRSLPFELVRKGTNDFNETSLKHGGNKLGQGGFGAVYLARIARSDLPKDEELNCELDFTNSHYLVAVKKVANEYRDQYANELKCLAEFRHPNLLNLIGLSQQGDTLCILSEYMINGSLHDCLLETNVHPIQYGQRIRIIGQIIDAICHLHTFRSDKGPLVHRDISSNNILLDRNFNSKLGDFGLARLLSSKGETKTSNAIGTSCYMPMEAIRGRFGFLLLVFWNLEGLKTQFLIVLHFISYKSTNQFQ